MKNFNELSTEVQTQVKNVLRAYNEVNVIFENGKYNVTTGVCIKNQYAEDFEVVGRYFANDIFTEDEKIINYIEEFLSYPIQYKGKKDWDMIHKMESLRAERKQAKIQLINGNAEIVEIVNI